jgi:GNAT superfamily N-acetyltransferase
MDTVSFLEREMTEAEFARMNAGFDEHSIEHGNPIEHSERHGFVALLGVRFIGCASGLAYLNWFYLTDLFIEKAYRGQGLGATLLGKLEQRVTGLGKRYIYTWTAGYEAPGFYRRQGYEVFAELEEWYPTGHSRVGLRKTLGPS